MENNNSNSNANNKIILFAIGVLLGAVIASAAFLICAKTIGTNSGTSGQTQQMQGGTPPEMPSGENNSNSQGTPPEKPSENNSNNN